MSPSLRESSFFGSMSLRPGGMEDEATVGSRGALVSVAERAMFVCLRGVRACQ